LLSEAIDEVKAEITREAESGGVDKIFFRLLTPNGCELACSNMSSWENVGVSRTALKNINFQLIIIRKTEATKANLAPLKKAVEALTRCQRKPKRRLEGRVAVADRSSHWKDP
jgi:hypothetical protein